MHSIGRLLLTGLLCLQFVMPALGLGGADDTSVLCVSYFRFLLVQQVVKHAEGVAASAPQDARGEITEAARAWQEEQMGRVRGGLGDLFGDEARTRFSSFVAEYLEAEKAGDGEYLAELAGALGLPEQEDYAALRGVAVETVLQEDVAAASEFMSELETWVEVRGRDSSTPPLAIWLTRSEQAAPAQGARRRLSEATGAYADAEPEFGDFEGLDEEMESPLDTFGASLDEKRARKLDEAQAGMQQVAMERQAAEEEYGAAKLAAAQAEAEAMKRHAEKLAAVEQEALAQRENSWGNRLKNIVKATVTAAGGAFLGGVGAEAGKQAADAVFN
ncbi:MAG: hypothetical protein JXB04_10330 [Kiritimatiellae bacterium]|nr:hypothetical protein [Kiritimatiellia bacterium]